MKSGAELDATSPALVAVDTSPRPVEEPAVEEPVDRPRKAYKPELDGLRFVAFIIVFWSHAMPSGVGAWVKLAGPTLGPWLAVTVRAGMFGVDLFFVLSSYLITDLLLEEKQQRGAVDVKAFWARRILRIWPLYYAFLLAAVFVVPKLLPSEHLESIHLLAFATFTANMAFATWTGGIATVMEPLWSVSIEEQFYLVWPLVARRLSTRRLALLAATLVPLSFAVRVVLTMKTNDCFVNAVWTHSLARLDPIALGALLAIALRRRPVVLRLAASRGLLFGSACALYLTVRLGITLAAHPILGPLVYTFVAIACCGLVVGAMSVPPGHRSVLARPALVYLGKISYGLYVFHLFALQLVGRAREGIGVQGSAVSYAITPIFGFALAAVLAAASYRWWEKPFLRLKERFTVIRSAPVER